VYFPPCLGAPRYDLTLKAHLPSTRSQIRVLNQGWRAFIDRGLSSAISWIPTLCYGIFSHCRPAYSAPPIQETWHLQLFPFLGDGVLQVSFTMMTSLVFFVGVGVDSIDSGRDDERSKCCFHPVFMRSCTGCVNTPFVPILHRFTGPFVSLEENHWLLFVFFF